MFLLLKRKYYYLILKLRNKYKSKLKVRGNGKIDRHLYLIFDSNGAPGALYYKPHTLW